MSRWEIILEKGVINLFGLEQLYTGNPIVFYLILAWSIVWKGLALWKAARNSQRNWFIALLVFNTIGILEIIYIYFIAKKQEIKESSTRDPEVLNR